MQIGRRHQDGSPTSAVLTCVKGASGVAIPCSPIEANTHTGFGTKLGRAFVDHCHLSVLGVGGSETAGTSLLEDAGASVATCGVGKRRKLGDTEPCVDTTGGATVVLSQLVGELATESGR